MPKVRKDKSNDNEFTLSWVIPKGEQEIRVYEKDDELKVVRLWLN